LGIIRKAYQAVLDSVRKVLQGENAGEVADHDHGAWYRELFARSVAVGLLNPADLAGYSNAQVYVRNSMHVPMNSYGVRDALPVLLDMIREEQEPAVRVVLGHFLFVYIHPYMDGNGRMRRFLMNVMLSSGVCLSGHRGERQERICFGTAAPDSLGRVVVEAMGTGHSPRRCQP
jgi:hypothetical protein